MKKRIILASSSPRRRELLSLTGLNFDILSSDVDESIDDAINPDKAVEVLALRKAQAVAGNNPDAIIIGADTVVALNDQIYGKPISDQDAFKMLSDLSGKTHQVFTGVAFVQGVHQQVFVVSTDVTFYHLSEDEIWEYIHTGEPKDKAGAYGIQEKGGLLVKHIKGDYNNVVGLPVGRLIRELKNFLSE